MLRLINIKKVYTTKAGDTSALNNVNLEFPETGLVFITGKSGSGKTTMLNLIGGLDSITSGEIEINGKKFSELSNKEYDSYRNTFIGFIFQEYNLLPEYTVAKNIDIANELQGKVVSQEEIDEILELVDIAGLGDRLPVELSGGQKQRVAIARALIKNPQIIMADEPTGALDSNTGVQVMETLKKLSKQKLVVIVSHDLELAEKYADRIIRLKDGSIIEDVTLSDKEIKGNVFGDNVITVRNGADLDAHETETLLKAIREKKKINFTDSVTVREHKLTRSFQPIEGYSDYQGDSSNVELIKSKMKFKSAAGFGLRSLKVKPVRLIFTIILSVVAFAVFGVFDAVSSYTEAKAIASTLKSSYSSIATTGYFYGEKGTKEEEGYDIRLSQQSITKINEETGYNFRGILDLVDTISPDGTVYEKEISELSGKSPIYGKQYYSNSIDGIIEFAPSDFNGNTIRGFNYKVVAGEYPQYEDVGQRTTTNLKKVGISNYIADSILAYIQRDDSTYNGTHVYGYNDLIGQTITLTGNSWGIDSFVISCIIQMDAIPSKYDKIKADTSVFGSNIKNSEIEDYNSYLSSSPYKCLFVGKGWTETMTSKNNVVPSYTYYLQSKKITFVGGTKNFVGTESEAFQNDPSWNISNFYKDSDVKGKNIVFLDSDRKIDDDAKLSLADNEVILSVEDFVYMCQNLQILKNNLGVDDEEVPYKTYYTTLVSNISNASAMNDKNEISSAVSTLMSFISNNQSLKDLFVKVSLATMFRKQVYSTDGTALPTIDNLYDIVGIYYDVNPNLTFKSWQRRPIIISESQMAVYGVYSQQGIYTRAVAPVVKNGAKNVAQLITNDDGLALNWYGNKIVDTIKEQRYLIGKFFDLFFYASIVLALFSVFMFYNYISASINAKKQSIGILRALGSNVKDITIMFIVESLAIAIVNAIFACFVTWLSCFFVNKYVMDIMNFSMKFVLFDGRQILLISLVSILTSIISSIIPIIKISKVKPVELIRKSL